MQPQNWRLNWVKAFPRSLPASSVRLLQLEVVSDFGQRISDLMGEDIGVFDASRVRI
jgi:hypothetical protein